MNVRKADVWNQPQDKYNSGKDKAGKKEKADKNSFLGLRFFHVSTSCTAEVSCLKA
jgi:hypothetical protein